MRELRSLHCHFRLLHRAMCPVLRDPMVYCSSCSVPYLCIQHMAIQRAGSRANKTDISIFLCTLGGVYTVRSKRPCERGWGAWRSRLPCGSGRTPRPERGCQQTPVEWPAAGLGRSASSRLLLCTVYTHTFTPLALRSACLSAIYVCSHVL